MRDKGGTDIALERGYNLMVSLQYLLLEKQSFGLSTSIWAVSMNHSNREFSLLGKLHKLSTTRKPAIQVQFGLLVKLEESAFDWQS